jgi:hypothetical protein
MDLLHMPREEAQAIRELSAMGKYQWIANNLKSDTQGEIQRFRTLEHLYKTRKISCHDFLRGLSINDCDIIPIGHLYVYARRSPEAIAYAHAHQVWIMNIKPKPLKKVMRLPSFMQIINLDEI